jgi:hypothetical protein
MLRGTEREATAARYRFTHNPARAAVVHFVFDPISHSLAIGLVQRDCEEQPMRTVFEVVAPPKFVTPYLTIQQPLPLEGWLGPDDRLPRS